jgi:hypothetical protein
LGLRRIVEAAAPEELFGWPNPTKADYEAFGEIMWLFTGLDFVQRMTAEVMDDNGMLQPPFKGNTRNLTIKRTADAIASSPIWSDANKQALKYIDERRKLRNLIAHFVVKRFREEDAFIFLTKSAADYEQVYGVRPAPNQMLYGLIDSSQIHGAIRHIRGLLEWAEKIPRDLSRPVDSKP